MKASIYEKSSTFLHACFAKNNDLMEEIHLYKGCPKEYKFSEFISGFIYAFKDKKEEIIYIGKTTDLVDRMLSHTHLDNKCYESIESIEYFKVDYFIDLDKVERALIKEYRPRYNSALKQRRINEKNIKFNMNIEWSLLDKSFYPSITRKKIKKEKDNLKLLEKEKEKLKEEKKKLEEERKRLKLEARSIKKVGMGIYKSPYCTSRVLRFGEFQYYKSDKTHINKYKNLWYEKLEFNMDAAGVGAEYKNPPEGHLYSPNREKIDYIKSNTFIENVKTIPYLVGFSSHKTSSLIQSRAAYEIIGITQKGKLSKKDVSYYIYSRTGKYLYERMYINLNNKKKTVYMYIDENGNKEYIASIASGRYNYFEELTRSISEEEAYEICSAPDYKK